MTSARGSEVTAAARLAAFLNHRDGTDYAAVRAATDPPDVHLVSRSGLPRLDVEVVTAPIDGDTGGQLLREDRGDIAKLEGRLVDALRGAGLSDAHLQLGLQSGRRPSAVKSMHLRSIVAFARNCPSPGHRSLTDTEVFDYDESLSESVLQMSVYCNPWFGEPEASLLLGGFVSRDGSWIHGAVMAKARAYAPTFAAKLLLVVDAALFIDDQEVDAFAAVARTLSLPFRAVWVVPRGGRLRCVWPAAVKQ